MARDFVDLTGTESPTMLWDPSFTTWRSYGVNRNSEMLLLDPDLEPVGGLVFGFSQERQDEILAAAADLG